MKLPEDELRAAIYTRLDGNLKYPVYSTAPDNEKYPYALIGNIAMADLSTKCGPGQEIHVDFDCIDAGIQSTKRISDLAAEVIENMTTEVSSTPNLLDLTNFNVAGQYFDMCSWIPQPDPEIKRMTLRMRFILTEL